MNYKFLINFLFLLFAMNIEINFAFGIPACISSTNSHSYEICESQIIYREDVSASKKFSDVSIDGVLAVVGSPEDDEGGTHAGAAYIYESINGVWIQQQKLIASDASDWDRFGGHVSISDNAIAVSSPEDSDPPYNQSVYIFERENANWVEKQKITATDVVRQDWFGRDLKINDDFLMIGAVLDDDLGLELMSEEFNSGSVYFFKKENGKWEKNQKIIASDGGAKAFFGHSLTFEEGVLAVGAPGASDTLFGSVYIFNYENKSWIESQKIVGPDSSGGDNFGYVVALDEGHLVISAPWVSNAQGQVYVYENENGVWTEKAQLVASDAQDRSYFGHCLAINEDKMIIGAPHHGGKGAAYFFTKVNGSWLEAGKFIPSDLMSGDRFCKDSGISGDTVIVSGDKSDQNGRQPIYIFDLDASTMMVDSDQDAVLDSDDNCPNDNNPDQLDTDYDGIGDECDSAPFGPDDDGDGIGNAIDNCINESNEDQLDTDSDGMGDACDLTPNGEDPDGDNIGDVLDNCPLNANPQQQDIDDDGEGDECDLSPFGPYFLNIEPEIFTQGSYHFSFDSPSLIISNSSNNNSSGSIFFLQKAENGDWSQVEKFSQYPTLNDNFGYRVISKDGKAFVADKNDNLYFYERLGDNWQFKQTLIPSLDINEWSIGDISISGDFLFVSVRGLPNINLTSKDYRSAAKIYKLGGNGFWDLHQTIFFDDIGVIDNNDCSSLYSENTILVLGSYCDHKYGEYIGSIHIFNFNPSSGYWDLEQSVSGPSGYFYFGSEVSISQNSIFVSARNRFYPPGMPAGYGSVHIIQKNINGIWSITEKISASDKVTNFHDFFGEKIVAYQDTLFVSAAASRVGDENSGAVYVFKRDFQDSWVEIEKITAFQVDNFGWDLDFSDGYLAVSQTGLSSDNPSSVYIYDASGFINPNSIIRGDFVKSVLKNTSLSGSVSAIDLNGLTDGTYFSLYADPLYGTASIDMVTGEWSYIPNGSYVGVDTFTILVTDDLGGITEQEITITVQDTDIDNDGILDLSDNCPNDTNASQLDFDNDSIGDVCDEDIDGDGALNINDAFPDDATEQNDTDLDLVGDNTDNCVNVANQDQSDIDGDLIGDVCDADMDGDGFANVIENTFGGDETDNSDYATVMAGIEAFSVSDDPLDRAVPAMGMLSFWTLFFTMLGLGAIRNNRIR